MPIYDFPIHPYGWFGLSDEQGMPVGLGTKALLTMLADRARIHVS